MNESHRQESVDDLLEIMARLRDPASGCPWDIEQTFATIAPYTIEEAYEVADAIERDAMDELVGELGDLLLQVVYHAQMAREQGAFGFADVVAAICRKMIRRHPHVFSDSSVSGADELSLHWEEHKAGERERQGSGHVLADVPAALPALMRAAKLGRRAARVGFDWPDAQSVRDKVDEELEELDRAVIAGDASGVASEAGDVFFALVNYCRHLKLDPEQCLRAANARFEQRFAHIERRVNDDRSGWAGQSPDDLERFWAEAKEELP
jgi:ATP diphosphatase